MRRDDDYSDAAMNRAAGLVPTNEELYEAAKDKTMYEVVRNWIDRHMGKFPNGVNTRDEWLSWMASNFLADPEIQAVLIRINALTAEAAEAETVMMICDFLRREAMQAKEWVVNAALSVIAGQIDMGAWHKEQEPTNPELWKEL